jgi:hypothetical protein
MQRQRPSTPITVKLKPHELARLDAMAQGLSLDGERPATRSDVLRALLVGRVPAELLKAAQGKTAA